LDKLAVFMALSDEERLKAAQSDSTNPFLAAYLNGVGMQEDDPWLQPPKKATVKKTEITPQPTLPKTTPVVKENTVVENPVVDKPKEELTQPIKEEANLSAKINTETAEENAAFDFLLYGALFTAGLGGIVVAILAWPVIVPALVTAGVISASSATATAATLIVAGAAVAGAAAAFGFFRPSSGAEDSVSDKEMQDKPKFT
jgi:hypothetical protein